MRISIIAISLFALSSSAYGSEFWANKRGGGADEVLLHKIQSSSNVIVSSSDEPEVTKTDDGLVYDVSTPVDSTFGISESVNLSEVIIEGSDGEVVEAVIDEETDEGAIKIPAGEWKITIPNRSAKSIDSRSARNIVGEKIDIQDGENAPQIAVHAPESLYALATDVTEEVTRSGKVLYFSAYLTDNVTSDDSSDDIAGRVIQGEKSKITAVVRFPSGKKFKVRLRDNGNSRNRDTVSGDDIFSGRIRISAEGLYRIKFKLTTKHSDAPIKLSARSTTDVASSRMSLTSRDVAATKGIVLDEPLEDSRYGLPLKVRVVKGNMPEIVNTRAEVWAFDESGNASSVGWIGGMVMPVNINGDKWHIPFTFHEGWLEQGPYTGAITIQNIEINDLDTGDQLVVNNDQDVAVHGISLQSGTNRSATGKSPSTSPSKEMMNGVHPSFLPGNVSLKVQARTRGTEDLLFLRG